MRKITSIAVWFVLLTLVFTSCSAAPSSNPAVAGSAAETAAPTPAYSENTPFVIDGVTYTVRLVGDVDINALATANGGEPIYMIETINSLEGGKLVMKPADNSLRFVTVVISVANNGSSALSISSFHKSTLTDSNGNVYSIGIKPAYDESIKAGASKDTGVVFPIKKDAKGLVILFQAASAEPVEITLADLPNS